MIQVFTCLTGNSALYAKQLKENLTPRVGNQLIFSAIADDTFEGKTDWDIKEIVPRIYPNGAANHGQMLNRIVKYIDHDATIVVVVDVDILVIPHIWCDIISFCLLKHGAVISPKFSGASGPFFCAFPVWLYRAIIPDWMPGTKENGYLTKTDQMDTGWRLRDLFERFSPLYLEFENRLSDGSNYNYFYYITDYVFDRFEPFMSHMGGSHKYDIDSEKAQNWINSINKLR